MFAMETSHVTKKILSHQSFPDKFGGHQVKCFYSYKQSKSAQTTKQNNKTTKQTSQRLYIHYFSSLKHCKRFFAGLQLGRGGI